MSSEQLSRLFVPDNPLKRLPLSTWNNVDATTTRRMKRNGKGEVERKKFTLLIVISLSNCGLLCMVWRRKDNDTIPFARCFFKANCWCDLSLRFSSFSHSFPVHSASHPRQERWKNEQKHSKAFCWIRPIPFALQFFIFAVWRSQKRGENGIIAR